jgi:hypothetical protein
MAFAAQIRLALDKCKVYYAKLDDSAAILASSVLHPGRGWPFIKQLWKNKSQWVVAGKERVENLWLSQYAEEPAAAVTMPIVIPLNYGGVQGSEIHAASGSDTAQ